MPAVIWTPKETVDLIQALFLQGINPSKIAEKTKVNKDTIKGLIRRKGWGKAKVESQAILITKNPQEPAVQAQSARIRFKLASVIEQDLDSCSKLRPSLARQQKLEPLVRNAKVALGWGEEHTQVLVNISALNPTDPGNAPIDVSSVATALPLAAPAAGSTEPVSAEPQQPVQLPHD